MKTDNFRQEVEMILKTGIVEYGTRYEYQSKLVYHFWSRRYSEDDCYNAISEWYRAYDHRSKDWKSNPERVLRNLRSAIKSFYQNAKAKGYEPKNRWEQKQLRTTDVQKIIALSADYRLQKFIFSLLQYALNNKDQNDEFRLPRVVIVTFDLCSKESYQAKVHFCEMAGFLKKEREYFRQERRARTYRIKFPFDEAGESVRSLEEGLTKLFNQEELKSRYSRWVYEKYLRNYVNMRSPSM